MNFVSFFCYFVASATVAVGCWCKDNQPPFVTIIIAYMYNFNHYEFSMVVFFFQQKDNLFWFSFYIVFFLDWQQQQEQKRAAAHFLRMRYAQKASYYLISPMACGVSFILIVFRSCFSLALIVPVRRLVLLFFFGFVKLLLSFFYNSQ